MGRVKLLVFHTPPPTQHSCPVLTFPLNPPNLQIVSVFWPGHTPVSLWPAPKGKSMSNHSTKPQGGHGGSNATLTHSLSLSHINLVHRMWAIVLVSLSHKIWQVPQTLNYRVLYTSSISVCFSPSVFLHVQSSYCGLCWQYHRWANPQERKYTNWICWSQIPWKLLSFYCFTKTAWSHKPTFSLVDNTVNWRYQLFLITGTCLNKSKTRSEPTWLDLLTTKRSIWTRTVLILS